MTASLHQFLHLRLTQSSVSSGGTGLPEEVWKSEGWNFPGGMLKGSGVRSQETFAKILFLPANECCLFLMNASVSGEAAVSQSPWKVLCLLQGGTSDCYKSRCKGQEGLGRVFLNTLVQTQRG